MTNRSARLLRHGLLAAAALSPLAAAPAADAAPRSETAASGQVSAKLSWDQSSSKGASDVRVSITRAGSELVSESVQPDCREFCLVPPGDQPLRILDLDGDGEPEVLVDLYSGGAHCCSVLLLYGFDQAAGQYERVQRDFGNPGYTLRDVGRDGSTEVFTEDDRFSYLFTSYLESFRPLMVLRYERGALVDVTRSLRGELRRHARELYATFKRLRRDGDLDLRGVAAAWQADNYLLGGSAPARGWKTLRAAARRGELRRVPPNGGRSGTRYLTSLRRYLKRFGYIR